MWWRKQQFEFPTGALGELVIVALRSVLVYHQLIIDVTVYPTLIDHQL
jgi:hypothetical protein